MAELRIIDWKTRSQILSLNINSEIASLCFKTHPKTNIYKSFGHSEGITLPELSRCPKANLRLLVDSLSLVCQALLHGAILKQYEAGKLNTASFKKLASLFSDLKEKTTNQKQQKRQQKRTTGERKSRRSQQQRRRQQEQANWANWERHSAEDRRRTEEYRQAYEKRRQEEDRRQRQRYQQRRSFHSHFFADPYATLEVSRSASWDEIRKAYRTAALKYHPDTSSLPEEEAKAKFQKVNDAFNSLKIRMGR